MLGCLKSTRGGGHRGGGLRAGAEPERGERGAGARADEATAGEEEARGVVHADSKGVNGGTHDAIHRRGRQAVAVRPHLP
jgi:hypothetical protein